MLEGLRPMTGFAAVLAAGSAGLLLLALLGGGGRVGPHPADQALMPPLPEPPAVAEVARLGPMGDYLAVGERPLFLPDRRPLPITAVAAEAEAPFEGVLSSVLLTGSLQLAIFSEQGGALSRRVRLGEVLPGTSWRLVGLEPRRAVLEGPGGQRVLELRVFDGKGGIAPTAVRFAAPTTEARPIPGGTPAPDMPFFPVSAAAAEAAPPMTPDAEAAAVRRAAEEQAQIEAIRARIEARRAALREGNLTTAVPVEQ